MNSAAEQLAEAVSKAESCKFNSLTCSCLSKVLSAAANKLCDRTNATMAHKTELKACPERRDCRASLFPLAAPPSA